MQYGIGARALNGIRLFEGRVELGRRLGVGGGGCYGWFSITMRACDEGLVSG